PAMKHVVLLGDSISDLPAVYAALSDIESPSSTTCFIAGAASESGFEDCLRRERSGRGLHGGLERNLGDQPGELQCDPHGIGYAREHEDATALTAPGCRSLQ